MKAQFKNALGTDVLQVESVETVTIPGQETPMMNQQTSIKFTPLVQTDVVLTAKEAQKLGQMLQQGMFN